MPQDTAILLAQAAAPGAGHSEAQAHAGAAGHAGHEPYKLGDIPEPGLLFANGILVAVILIALAWRLTRTFENVPRGWQNLGEWIVEVFSNFVRGIIGPGAERYVPLIGTLFFFIYFSNIIGLIPGFHSPTANLSTTLALGLIVFFYVQYIGIKSNGIKGYLKHFAGPMPAVAIILFPIELISELVKPFTLALRLFGNIFGEDTVIIALASMAVLLLPKAPILPLQLPILMLALMTTFVQALVFVSLTCVYIALQSHHEDDHAHEPGHAGLAAGAEAAH